MPSACALRVDPLSWSGVASCVQRGDLAPRSVQLRAQRVGLARRTVPIRDRPREVTSERAQMRAVFSFEFGPHLLQGADAAVSSLDLSVQQRELLGHLCASARRRHVDRSARLLWRASPRARSPRVVSRRSRRYQSGHRASCSDFHDARAVLHEVTAGIEARDAITAGLCALEVGHDMVGRDADTRTTSSAALSGRRQDPLDPHGARLSGEGAEPARPSAHLPLHALKCGSSTASVQPYF